jgi:hypothetical protein
MGTDSASQSKALVKNIWLENIGTEGIRNKTKSRKIFMINDLESHKSSVTVIAMNILFPGNVWSKLHWVQNLPDEKPEEKKAKELAFRNLILKHFDMKQVASDNNNGLRAIICGLNPELDPRSEEITAIILRGDLVDFIMKHPENLSGGNDPDRLKSYCFEMVNNDAPITLNEIGIMSDILETPIYIYRYDDARLGSEHKISPGENSVYGSRYHRKKPICLYYDPVRLNFMPLHAKGPKKFGVLNES